MLFHFVEYLPVALSNVVLLFPELISTPRFRFGGNKGGIIVVMLLGEQAIAVSSHVGLQNAAQGR
jgi:hypothetical protein